MVYKDNIGALLLNDGASLFLKAVYDKSGNNKNGKIKVGSSQITPKIGVTESVSQISILKVSKCPVSSIGFAFGLDAVSIDNAVRRLKLLDNTFHDDGE